MTALFVRERSTISVEFVAVADPIASGFAESLGRPGGNLSGIALYEPGMGGKWVQLLKEIAPASWALPCCSIRQQPCLSMPSVQEVGRYLDDDANVSPLRCSPPYV